MPIVAMKEMLQHAHDHGYAVGAFDLFSLDVLEGVMAAAERCRSPVILNLTETHFDCFDFELLMPAIEAAARRAAVPVAIHLDQGTSLASAVRAINSGCNSIMVAASHKAFTDNIHLTREVVNMARACGVPVEGEPGDMPAVEEARTYVEQTGVDFLTVATGTKSGHSQDGPKPDYPDLQEINKTLRIPLVIHGGAALSEDQIRRLIAQGVARINFDTALYDAADSQIRANAKANHRCSLTGLMQGVRDVVGAEVAACMHRLGSMDRAEELLLQCTPWAPVEHLIIYNVSGISEHGVDAMLAEGRRVLGTIPGVREVIAGRAIKEDAKYRYTWLIRFCHSAVIDSYREHPVHAAFADQLFRPVAADRISIDYQSAE